MTSLYSQAQEFQQTQNIAQSLGDKWAGMNFNVSNKNASRNTYTEMTELAELGSPFAQQLVKKSMAEADFQAKLSELMKPTGLVRLKSAEGTDRTQAQIEEGAALRMQATPYLRSEEA